MASDEELYQVSESTVERAAAYVERVVRRY